MYTILHYDRTKQQATTLEQAFQAAKTYLKRWMEPGDHFHTGESVNAAGRRYHFVQVLDEVSEPTDVIAYILTPDEG